MGTLKLKESFGGLDGRTLWYRVKDGSEALAYNCFCFRRYGHSGKDSEPAQILVNRSEVEIHWFGH